MAQPLPSKLAHMPEQQQFTERCDLIDAHAFAIPQYRVLQHSGALYAGADMPDMDQEMARKMLSSCLLHKR